MDPIKEAIFQSDLNKVSDLIQAGEKWSLDAFMTAQTIEKALKAENFDFVDVLIEKEIISLDIFEYDSFKNSIFEILLQLPFTESLKNYIEKIIDAIENIDEDLGGKTWLDIAIEKKANFELFEIIVAAGCPIDNINKNEETYLFKTSDLDLVNYFIQEGIDINKQNLGGKTAFWNAVSIGNKELIQVYLDNGIDVNLPNNKGETIYDIIVFEMMDMDLFKQIADYDLPRFDLKNKSGQSLFMKQISMSSFGNSNQIIKTMLEYGADLFQEENDAYGNTITAADELAKQSFETFEMLSDGSFLDVNSLDNNGNTWLHKICMLNLNFDEAKAKELYKKVKLLLKLGADASLKNDEDKSPIDYAQDDNLKSKVLSLLLKNKN